MNKRFISNSHHSSCFNTPCLGHTSAFVFFSSLREGESLIKGSFDESESQRMSQGMKARRACLFVSFTERFISEKKRLFILGDQESAEC